MLNVIWVVLLIIGILVGIANGKISEINSSLLSSAGNAVQFGIGIMGIICLWCGIMNIASDAGVVNVMAKLLRPVIHLLFPRTRRNKEAEKQVITNLIANFLGLGNGATPSGISAVKELQKSTGSDVAVKDVCLFLVINSAAIQLIPTTVIALRAASGAKNPADILIPTWISSISGCIIAIIIFFLLSIKRKKVKK